MTKKYVTLLLYFAFMGSTMWGNTPLQEKDISQNPQVKGGNSCLLKPGDGFNPSGEYTVELKVKAGSAADAFIDIFGAAGVGKGYKFSILDSTFNYVNPMYADNPRILHYRKNSNKEHVFRFAITNKDSVHVYRNGIFINVFSMRECPLPLEVIEKIGTEKSNLLVNGDFSNSEDIGLTYVQEEKVYTMIGLNGWTVYPHDVWNSRFSLEDTDEGKAVKIRRYEWNAGGQWSDAKLSQVVNVAPESTYTFECMAMGGMLEGAKNGYLQLQEVQSTGRGKRIQIDSEEFKSYSMEYTTSADCKQLRLILGLTFPGAGEWNATPEVPIYVTKAQLKGKEAVPYEKALGFNCSTGVEIEYLSYDLTGAYAPVIADIITDKKEISIDGTQGQQSIDLKITGKGLRSDEYITFATPPGLTVSPAVIPSNSSARNVKVTYNGTKNNFTDTLYIRSGETIRPVVVKVKGTPLVVKSLAESAQIKNQNSFELSNFNPVAGYTMEIKAKVKEGSRAGVKLYSSLPSGEGIEIAIGDSIITVDNPKARWNNPDSIICRKNADLMRTYRLTVSPDNRLYVYRDGNIADTLKLSDFVVPAGYTAGYENSSKNLLKNGDFNGETSFSYLPDEPNVPFADYVEGWNIYPIEEWNSRQYIANWAVDEEQGSSNKAFRMERYEWNAGWTDAMISQVVNVVGGQPYTLSALAQGGIYKKNGAKYAYMRIEEVQNPNSGKRIAIQTVDPSIHTLEYTPSATCQQLRVIFGLTSPGKIEQWPPVPRVPVYFDNVVLTGPKVKGKGIMGFVAEAGTEVEYFAYDVENAYAAIKPEIEVSADTITLDKTGKSTYLRISGNGLVPGEDIYLTAPTGLNLSATKLPYNASKSPLVIKLESSLKNYTADIILKSGKTKKVVHVIGKGTKLPEKDLSIAPAYTGNDAAWEITETDGFNPSDKGYTVEVKLKNKLLNSEFKWYGVEKEGTAANSYLQGLKGGVYNAGTEELLFRINNTEAYNTYRYAVTPDNHMFIYCNNAPVDTLFLADYAVPAGFSTTEGDMVENLLHNPGFEEIYTPYTMPDDKSNDVGEYARRVEGWTIETPTNGWNVSTHIKKMRINDELDEDNHVAILRRYTWQKKPYWGLLSQVVNVVPGEEYNLEVLAKGGDQKGFIRIEEVQNTSEGTEIQVKGNSFEKYTLFHRPSADCDQIRVILGIYPGSEGKEVSDLYFDDAKLSGKKPTLIQKLGFNKVNTDLEYFTYDVTGAYAPVMPNVQFSEESLAFGSLLEEKKITISTSNVEPGATVEIIPSAGFVVEPEILTPNAQNQNVTVTFVSTQDRSNGTLMVKIGRLVEQIPMSGKTSPLEGKDLSQNPVYTNPQGIYELTEENGFTPGKAGYTVELKGELEEFGGGSFVFGAVNNKDLGFKLAIAEEFTAVEAEKGTVDFIGGVEIPNPGTNTFRLAVAPDNMAFVFKNEELVDTLNLNDYPIDERFVKTGESVESSNLLLNPNFNKHYEYEQFEEAFMLSKMEAWRLGGINEWNARAYVQADTDDASKNVLKIERYEWNPGWADAQITQVVNVCPNSKYTFKALVQGGAEGGLNLAYMGYEEVGTGRSHSINISGNSDFGEKSLEFTTSATCAQVKVSFWLKAHGKEGQGPKAPFYIKDVVLSGKKPVFRPAIFLESIGDFRLDYFTYDLTGAYVPDGYTTSIEEVAKEKSLEITGYAYDGNIYLKEVPEQSVISIYNVTGQLVKQVHNYVNDNPIQLNSKGLHIINVVYGNQRSRIKIIN